MPSFINSLSISDQWFYGSCIMIIITLGGILFTHRLLLFRDRKKNFFEASKKLIEAFSPAIACIDAAVLYDSTHDSPDVNSFLCDSFETHDAAVNQFEAYITRKRKRKAFKKAWEEYCELEPYHGGITLFAGHYAPNGKHLEFIKEKIEIILKFGKLK